MRKILLCVGAMLAVSGFAQSFEVASVRPSAAGAPSLRQMKPDGLMYTDRSLGEYIRLAYDVQPFQLSGPAGAFADRYDIVAKAASAVPQSQVKLMLRSLLEDRFKLRFHRETKELPAFILTVDKGGPRFQASADEGSMGAELKDGGFHYRRTSMAYLTGSVLSNLPSLGRPVIDQTGLEGIYDFSLMLFDPDAAKTEVDPKGGLLQQLDNGLRASLKNLGLKLESKRTAIEMLVVDHVEKPSAN